MASPAMTDFAIGRAKSRVTNAKSTTHLQNTIEVIESLRYQKVPGNAKPWLDEEGRVIWTEQRIKVARFVYSQAFETIMGIIIMGNLGLIMWEADQDAKCYPNWNGKDQNPPYEQCPHRSDMIEWLQILNILLLVIYTLECSLRFFVDRGKFFCNTWNIIDFLTVVLGWMATALANNVNLGVDVSLLRLSRLVRVVRAARVFISVPELYLLISGLYSSIKAIIFGSLMLATVISFWAVISVEVFHPDLSEIVFPECPRCHLGFQSVWEAAITLFQQIVAGDSWGVISIPLIDKQPWMFPVLMFIMMTISLGVMNLILAVIVERAAEARANDQERKMKQQEADRARNMLDLAHLCASMDADGSGSLSLDEMLNGFDSSEAFQQLMQYMDVKRDDVETIFHVLDEDGSGEVSYLEFCKHLGSFFERDPKIVNSVVKYSMMELRQVVKEEVMETLHEHTQMLKEQRLLLESLRPPRPAGPRAPAAPAPDAFGSEVLEALELPPKALEELLSLEAAQKKIEPLLTQAEELAASALLDAWQPPPKKRGKLSKKKRSFTKSLSSLSPTMSPSSTSGEEDGHSRHSLASKALGQELEERFELLCQRFEQRIREAENVQDRCGHMLSKIQVMKGSLQDDLHGIVVEEKL